MATTYDAYEMELVDAGWDPETHTLKVKGVCKSKQAIGHSTAWHKQTIAHCVCLSMWCAGCTEETGRAVADFLKRLDHEQPLHVRLKGDPGDNTAPLQ